MSKDAKKLSMDNLLSLSGRLVGALEGKHSLLRLKIWGIIFSDWNDGKSFKAYESDHPETPRLYLRSYNPSHLRCLPSMSFNEESFKPAYELLCMNSVRGMWQRKARDFLQRHIGVYLHPDSVTSW